jgi:uncharacterized membrane protein YedE/YeeE
MYTLASFLIGLLFGVGLVISNMINPNKVLNFLDITGDWDPSLLFVMAAATTTTAIGLYFVRKRQKPLLTDKFHYPTKHPIDKELIIGSAIFGIGWGMTGYCPGPAITVLGTFQFEVLYFLAAMILGSLCYTGLSKITCKSQD